MRAAGLRLTAPLVIRRRTRARLMPRLALARERTLYERYRRRNDEMDRVSRSRPARGRPATRWCRRSRTNWTTRPGSDACARRAAQGRSAVSTEGLSRLSVGGAIWSRIARIEKIASTAPAAPSRWPIEDLVDDIVVLPARIAEQPLDRAQFDLVADRRRGAVRVDVVDLGGRQPARFSAALIARKAPSPSGEGAVM